MKRFTAFTLLLMVCLGTAFAQGGREYRDVFPTIGNFERKAWSFSLGGTYMFPMYSENMEPVETAEDSLFRLGFDPGGRPGIAVEVGRVVAPERFGPLKWVDVSAGVKQFRGVEKASATLLDGNYANDDSALEYNTESSYNSWIVNASLRLGHYFPVADYTVISNSLGLNLDYMLSGNMDYDDSFPGNNATRPSDLLLQMHYRLGVGVKLSEKHLLHFSLETPVLSMIPFDDGRSTSHYYHTRYRPVIARVALLIFDSKPGIDCPTNVKTKSKNPEQLFDKKNRRNKHPW